MRLNAETQAKILEYKKELEEASSDITLEEGMAFSLRMHYLLLAILETFGFEED